MGDRDEFYCNLNKQGILFFKVLSDHFSYEWLKETVSMVSVTARAQDENYTLVHLAAKGGLI